MRSIVLVGFMGTGKSLIGENLSRRLHWPLLDTDTLIVREAHKPITRIFSEDGETVFREMETQVLKELAAEAGRQRIISTGGGIVLAERNWPWLRQLGHVICLQARPETILQRVGSAQDRPLLAGTPEEVRQRIDSLLAARSQAYARADWQCVTDRQSPSVIVENIIRWCEAQADQKGKEHRVC